jgi:3-isopropylmalate/(R)-2-methylmalate dehydratase small subunit
LDIERGILKNLSKEIEEPIKPYPKEIMEIMESGGLIEYMKKRGSLLLGR